MKDQYNQEVTPVGNCFHCKKDANWNAPALDHDNNVWCNRCVDDDRSGIMFRTIEQRLTDGMVTFTGGVVFNGVVVWIDRTVWTDGGRRSVKLTGNEKSLPVEVIARLLDQEHNIQGLTRCTGCGTKMTQDQIAGYPLFAGVVCAPCNQKHLEHLEGQRKSGHVCRMCGKPYDACCC